MILDFRSRKITFPDPEDEDFDGMRCTSRLTVDGKEISQVWFADFDRGVIKTYDIFGDGKLHSVTDFKDGNVPSGVEVIDGAILSKTIAGKVELVAASPERK